MRGAVPQLFDILLLEIYFKLTLQKVIIIIIIIKTGNVSILV
jgi:hypothetical protein